MAYSNTAIQNRPGILERIGQAVRYLQERSEREAIRRRTYRELSALTDRDLNDLGVHRSMIGQLAREAAYQK